MSFSDLWRSCWTEGTPATRFRLMVILGLLTLLGVLLVDLATAVWLGLADLVTKALTQ